MRPGYGPVPSDGVQVLGVISDWQVRGDREDTGPSSSTLPKDFSVVRMAYAFAGAAEIAVLFPGFFCPIAKGIFYRKRD